MYKNTLCLLIVVLASCAQQPKSRTISQEKNKPPKTTQINPVTTTPKIRDKKIKNPAKSHNQEPNTYTSKKLLTEKIIKINAGKPVSVVKDKPQVILSQPLNPKTPKKIKHSEVKLSGTVNLIMKAKSDEAASKKDTVIYFIPDNFTHQISKKTYSIKMQNKRFTPNVLVVPVGSTVTFPNQDRILHNVFSVSKIAPFDLGLYAAGNQKQVQLNKPGIAYVNCNVHHAMHADILVIDTPFYTHLSENNQFELKNLPSSKGTLYVWHPRAQLQEIVVNSQSKLNINLPITRSKIPQHLNKFGLPYTKKRK